ncbi:FKBP-type peptidyl-prolyl cis-trans isomerase N-terminal domain-containing protein, partial [Bacillus sp. SIMBA_154]|uniref:FKBP-type peptidyl-prolyl cis-trans isomerase N-terminal domain-containing protein n=1 Tax=Bacillus sp. SIMBA_154 TaxID=3080859 RepID=UPI00397BAB56
YMLERDIVIAGFVDAVKGDPQLSEEEAEKILNAMREEVMEHRQNVLGKKAAEEGKAYLAENAKKEGVQTTDSGLQYEVLEEGDGVS